MKILGIDGSGLSASVALLEDEKLIAEYTINNKLTHSHTLMPMISEVCKMVNLDLSTLDAIGVTSGPGSFTGLRISAGTAKGMALGLNIPIVGVPTLDAIAHNIPYTNYLICPIMDARRGHLYTALYKWDNDYLNKLTDHMLIPIDDVIKGIKVRDEKVIFLGDGIDVYKEKINLELGEKAHFAPPSLKLQRASTIAMLALEKAKNGDTISHIDFAPTYLRPSQAEREYKERKEA